MQTQTIPRSRRSQAERSATTTDLLRASARRLFAEKGYTATSLVEIGAAAGLTKGAIYHHFAGKEDIFRDVYEHEQRGLVQMVVVAALKERDPWDGFKAGWHAFLEASQEPSAQRITLVEGPVALGWQRMRDIGSSYTVAMLATGLERAMAAGRIVDRPVRPLARLLFAAMCEGSMMIAGASDQQEARRQVSAAIDALLTGLEVRPQTS
jgi:AcrR family transcriptional regulator